VAARVQAALERQARRAPDGGTAANASLDTAQLRAAARLEEGAVALLATAVDRLGLTGRAHDRVLKVALTIADLAGAERIGAGHLAEALQYRPRR
jgi:magnesium chelatase family protein